MANEDRFLVSVDGLAYYLRLDPGWLLAEAQAKRIPALNAGGIWLFDIDAVQAALVDRASHPDKGVCCDG